MSDVTSMIPSKKAVCIFFAIYIALFAIGVLGVLALPDEERSIRKIAFFVSYFFGLPVVLSAVLLFLRKIGAWNGK
jgi:uncharacterized membrane protein YiaA